MDFAWQTCCCFMFSPPPPPKKKTLLFIEDKKSIQFQGSALSGVGVAATTEVTMAVIFIVLMAGN
jgi:hypothetical protein